MGGGGEEEVKSNPIPDLFYLFLPATLTATKFQFPSTYFLEAIDFFLIFLSLTNI